MQRVLIALIVVVVALPSGQAQGIITTVAGTNWIFRGDGGPALSAPLGEPWGVVVDAAGNVYASDSDNDIVFKVSSSGILTVIAGNGLSGFSGDGGQAVNASLLDPKGVALDSAGNLYIAEYSRIRKVSIGGIITTVAGSGPIGFSGDGGPAIAARLSSPGGLAFDSAGNLFVADVGNNRIRKIDPAGVITTVAGSGNTAFTGDGGPATAAGLDRPVDVGVDAARDLYIVDSGHSRIRKVNAAGVIQTIAGNGTNVIRTFPSTGLPAADSVCNPDGLSVDFAGNVYISSCDRILRLAVTTLTLIAGTSESGYSGDVGPAVAAELNRPRDIAVDGAGNIIIADSGNGRLRRFQIGGIIVSIAGNGLYKYSGDGGPATSATLQFPSGVALDSGGNTYLADSYNNRIRKITPSGTITTMAGTGRAGFSGDGGVATEARLFSPSNLTLDSAGNLYFADSGNKRIRKVDARGIITTIAGKGGSYEGPAGQPVDDSGRLATDAHTDSTDIAIDRNIDAIYVVEGALNRVRRISGGVIRAFAGVMTTTGGFAGDNGPAASARLNRPNGVAVDAAGNVFIADTENHRVRKVSVSGIITTVAGNGTAGFSGDNGPATAAALDYPSNVSVDALGNLYISDQYTDRVRKVGPSGIITTIAGNGTFRFAGDGGLATSASLAVPSGTAVDSAGNLYIADSYNDRIRKVLVSATTFSVSPTNLTFAAQAGASGLASKQLAVSSAVTGLRFSATATTQSGGNWLSVSPSSGSVPGAITANVNVGTLAPGTYRGTITVLAAQASPNTQTVTVDLTVTAAPNPQLGVEPSSLTFEAAGSASLRISNAGGGTLAWSAQTSTTTGGNWLSASPASGSATSAASANVQINATTTGLGPGVYSGSVRVTSATTGESRTVGVTLLLSQQNQSIVLSQTGLLFTGVEGGGRVQSQSFGVLNVGQGTMNWTAEASTLSGGNWLGTSTPSGSSTADSLDIPLVQVNASTSGLRAGQYSGQVKVTASTANNSPQLVTVDFNVLPPGSNPGPQVRPTGLIFATRAGSSSPGSQTIRLGTPVAGNVEARAGAFTFDGGEWLDGQPRNVLMSGSDKLITVQPSLGTLSPNVYRGALTLLFDDGSPSQVVNVLFVVVPPGTTNSLGVEAPCVPQRLFTVHRTLGGNFSSPASWPAVIEAQVVDDCGNAVPNATVLATFSSGDAPLVLASLRTGIYTATWRPVNASGQVTVTLRATLPPLRAAEATVQGSVIANATAPTLYSQGIVNAASFAQGAELAPGTIISVFGKNLAQTGAASLPIPRTLGGATLTIGGADAPLFYSSDGQINAQIPFELAANVRHQAVVKTQKTGGQSITVPESITLAAVRPGIFSTNQQGSGQGAILNAGGVLVDEGAAAAAGEVVQVFATGLGMTNPVVASGQLAPSAEPLARVTAEVTAEIDGKPARVFFAGLAPGFVGLYQVNVEIPAGVSPGSAATLVLRQAGVPSNTVTLAVR